MSAEVVGVDSQLHPTTALTPEFCVILDAGSQYGKVIDRKIRELRVEARIMPLSTPFAALSREIDRGGLKAIIISGGPASVYSPDAPYYDPQIFELPIPILGICYGMQMMAQAHNGRIERQEIREDGQELIVCDVANCPLFDGLGKFGLETLETKQVHALSGAATENTHVEQVLLTHGDSITDPGTGFRVVARSVHADIISAIFNDSKGYFGVQFHPEVDLTVHGLEMFRNFLRYAKFSFSFSLIDREQIAIKLIQQRAPVGTKVLCLASGGVDSTVCAALLNKALGKENVVCIHINHGFTRKNESETVAQVLAAAGVDVQVVDAREYFRKAITIIPAVVEGPNTQPSRTTAPLEETLHPEDKRKIIGDAFMTVVNDAIRDVLNKKFGKIFSLEGDDGENGSELLLAQGTLRPDLIESGSHLASAKAEAIKTHHNDTNLVRELRKRGKIIEPLCDYHKDEVRELGKLLGLPHDVVMRQPFPGPGLAIRVLCTDRPFLSSHFDELASRVDSIVTGVDSSPLVQPHSPQLQALKLKSCLLPIRTVGVQGDGRTYAHAAAITCQQATFPAKSPSDASVPSPLSSLALPSTQEQWHQLLIAAKIIPKLCHGINRIVYCFGPLPPVSFKCVTPTTLTLPVIQRLQEADDIVNQVLMKYRLVQKLSQVPVVLLPLDFDDESLGKGEDCTSIIGAVGKKHSIVIRTFITSDFMTGVPAVPGSDYLPHEALEEMVRGVAALPFISRVMFDLTAKPPGTTEWE